MSDEVFNVVQFFEDGTSEYVRRRVSAVEAIDVAKHYTRSVAAWLGVVNRVIVTDMGDLTCFEWIRGKGITPPKVEL